MQSRSRSSRKFRPVSPVDNAESTLEPRLTMSGGLSSIGGPAFVTEQLPLEGVQFGTRVPPYLINSYSRGVQFRDSATSRVSDAIDRAFDSFTTDYLQAQAAFLASSSGESQLREVLQDVTQQRVNLLAQELTQTLVRIPGMLEREKGAPAVPLQQFLFRRINSPVIPTSLLFALRDNIKSLPTSPDAPQASLYSLSATNAIEAARVATINASKFASSRVFSQK